MDYTELPKVNELVSQLEINAENNNNNDNNNNKKLLIMNDNSNMQNNQSLIEYFETRKPKKKDYENLQWLTGC